MLLLLSYMRASIFVRIFFDLQSKTFFFLRALWQICISQYHITHGV